MITSPDDWPLKKITANQVAGSRGESFVSFLLSKYCLVRPVANGTDIGVDLYCEVLKDGIPHNHFWVQVKSSSKSFTKKKRLRISDLEYWSRQPIPVFIFFISVDDVTLLQGLKIEVIDLTEQFIGQLSQIDPKGNRAKYLTHDFVLNSNDDLEKFVFDTVAVRASRIKVRDGFIFPIQRTVHTTYKLGYQRNGISKYSKQFVKNIGRTAALLLMDICQSDEKENLFVHKKKLEEVLSAYIDSPNWDLHYALAYSRMISDKEHEAAIDGFKRALKIIESDKKFTPKETEQTRILIAIFISRLEKRIDYQG